MALLNDVRARLVALSLVEGGTGWSCYIDRSPDTQDQVVVLEDTGGFPDAHKGQHRYPTFKLSVRAAKHDYGTARVKWDAIYSALNGVPWTGATTTGHLMEAMQSGPIPLPDGNDRPVLSVNFRAIHS